MRETLTRRSLIERLGMAAGALAAIRVRTLAAADLPHLSPSDPTAMALGYTEDASKADRSKFPNYRPGEKCANCLQNMGTPGQTWSACKIFVGKAVNSNGWCSAYVKKA